MSTNDELRDLVQELYSKISGLESRIAKLEVKTKDVPEDHMMVIAAAVAAYLGEKGTRRQPRYASDGSWISSTRSTQHVHHSLYTR